jgi:hypothetical protein
MALNKENAGKMLYSVVVRWGLWGYGTELMCGDTLGAVGLRSRDDVWRYVGGCGAAEQSCCVEIRWELWGCGAELRCGDTLGAVGLRSRDDVWRYIEIGRASCRERVSCSV